MKIKKAVGEIRAAEIAYILSVGVGNNFLPTSLLHQIDDADVAVGSQFFIEMLLESITSFSRA
jgi:hypothetical protein